MSLSQNGFTYLSLPSDVIQIIGPHRPPIVIGEYFGVIGESHIISETRGADLACAFRFQEYESITTLRSDQRTLEGLYGKLTGTLQQTIGGNSATYQQCTFIEYRPFEAPWQDGGGTGWVQRGMLFWRQRRRG